MIVLQNHEQVESLFSRGDNPSRNYPAVAIIYFTAKWCAPCKKLNLEKIVETFPKALFYKLDIDELDHSAGWCNVRKIPSFMVLKQGKYRPAFTSSDTDTVIETIQNIILD
jgi:thioredoxin-like negative regulator of GroEL